MKALKQTLKENINVQKWKSICGDNKNVFKGREKEGRQWFLWKPMHMQYVLQARLGFLTWLKTLLPKEYKNGKN